MQAASIKNKADGMLLVEPGARPPLKWAGGKRWLVPHVRRLWEGNDHRRLVEPFSGGLAIALGLLPDRALLNDVNPHPINFYMWLKRGLRISIDMRNDQDLYYRHRAQFNQLIALGKSSSKACAEFFYYLNRTGYNGLCRFNKNGQFNVPFGRYKQINYRSDFMEYKNIFEAWHFSHGDFELLPLTSADLIYADPPYDVEFRQYSKEGFDWQDQVRLAKWLSAHRGPVIASNQATPRIVDLYRKHGFHIEILDAPRMISCTGDRSKAKEILAYRNI